MQQTYNNLFEHLPDSSKIWIYQNQGAIPQETQKAIQAKLDVFVRQWAAHKVQLYGASAILEDHFIVLAVDENMTAASGCSIDSSVHFIKELEKEFLCTMLSMENRLLFPTRKVLILNRLWITEGQWATKIFHP